MIVSEIPRGHDKSEVETRSFRHSHSLRGLRSVMHSIESSGWSANFTSPLRIQPPGCVYG